MLVGLKIPMCWAQVLSTNQNISHLCRQHFLHKTFWVRVQLYVQKTTSFDILRTVRTLSIRTFISVYCYVFTRINSPNYTYRKVPGLGQKRNAGLT
jgi:hypothetical protein